MTTSSKGENMTNETRWLYEHPEAGQFYVFLMSDYPRWPVALPYFCCGRYYLTREDAVAGFYDQCLDDDERCEDRSYQTLEDRMTGCGQFEDY